MKTRLSIVTAMVVLLVAQQVSQAQEPGFGMPAGYFAPPPGPRPIAPGGPQAAPGFSDGGCCDPSCSGRNCVDCWQAFGDFLFLRPGNVDIALGFPVGTPITGSGQPPLGPVAVVGSEHEPGFRVGIARALDECATLGVTYSHLEADSILSSEALPQGQTFFPLVIHPSQLIPGATYDSVFGRQDIDFRLVDVDYRHVFARGDRHAMSYLIGARYAHLQQDFAAGFFAPVVADDQTVFSRIGFDGGGIRLGLEGERHAASSGLLVYGRGTASFVAGQFRASYLQAQPDQLPSVDTSWSSGRLVSMLDLELGVGWASPGGRVRVTAGYMVAGWFNVVKTSDWIRAVQTADYNGLDNTLTFDGAVLRSEIRF